MAGVITPNAHRTVALLVTVLLALLFTVSAPQASTVENGKIGFITDRDGNYEIYSMNVDGSSPTNLTNHSGVDVDPKWSRDGSRMMFASARDGDAEDLHGQR